MKKIVVFTTLSIFLLTGLGNANGTDINLTIAKLIDLTIQKSSDYKLKSISYEKSNLSLQKLKKFEERGDIAFPSNEVSVLFTTKLSEEVTNKTADLEKEKVQVDSKGFYFEIIKTKKSLEFAKKKLERAQEMLLQAKNKYETGIVAKTEVLSSEASVAAAEAELRSKQMQEKLAINNLNAFINEDLNKEIVVDYNIVYEKSDEVNLLEVIPNALSRNVGYLNAEMDYKIKHEQSKIVKEFPGAIKKAYPIYIGGVDTSSTEDLKIIELELQEATIQLAEAEKAVALGVNQIYESVKSLESQIDFIEKQVELTKEMYRLTKLQFDNGLVTQLQLNQSSDALYEAEQNLLNIYMDHLKAKLDFGFMTGYDI